MKQTYKWLGEVRERTLAVVDIGSNTVHLLAARTDGRHIQTLADESEPLRLGADIDAEGALSDEKIQALVDTLQRYQKIVSDAGIGEVHFLATHAVRTAANRQEITEAVMTATEVPLEVLTPQQEAALAFLGADADCPSIGPQVVVDIGGGSMQVAIGQNGEMWDCVSLPLGTARVATRFLASDPPTYLEEAMLVTYLANVISPALPLRDTNVTGVLGTGGTLRRLPALLGLKTEQPFPIEALERGLAYLRGRKADAIAVEYDLKLDRAHLMMPAILLIREVLRGYGNPPFIIAAYGIREGAILHLARHSQKSPQLEVLT